jgi:hypothetical protein
MDSVITLANTLCYIAMSAAATWACLSRRVHDRIIMKLGLVLLAIGFAAHAYLAIEGVDTTAMVRAQLLINVGLVLVLLGLYLRIHAKPWRGPERRASDFVDLDVTRSERQS